MLSVPTAALHAAAARWEETSETIRGARRSLGDVEPALLGPRAAAAARRFLDTWMTELTTLQRAASDHGDALRETALLVHRADVAAAEWSQRPASWPEGSGTPTGGSS